MADLDLHTGHTRKQLADAIDAAQALHIYRSLHINRGGCTFLAPRA